MLRTSRLILRPWQDSDAESLYKYARDPLVGPAAGWAPHANVEESRQIIASILAQPITLAMVLRSTGEPVGSISLTPPTFKKDNSPQEGEIGYWLGRSYWAQGLMPEATEEMLRHGFEDLGMHTIWCAYFEGNDKSRRVQEKCGFVYHHTLPETYWSTIDCSVIAHVTRITKEEWQRRCRG